MNSIKALVPDPDASWALQGTSMRHYRIPGQGALRLRVKPGETLRISSADQLQCCELLPVNGEARQVLDALLPAERGPAQLFRRQLEGSRRSAQQLQAQLAQAGVDSQRVEGWLLSAQQLPLELVLPEEGPPLDMVLLAPGEDMEVEQQQPATELLVEHGCRARSAEELPLPYSSATTPPVPVQEIHIPHSSARVYKVKAGQWIQISDVAGKQCSDFIAFDLEALERGEEVSLDGTATRTLAGVALPQPDSTPGLPISRCRPCWSWYRTPWVATTAFCWPAPQNITRIRGISAMSAVPRISIGSWLPTASSPGPAGRRSTSFSTPRRNPVVPSAWTNPGLDLVIMC